MARIIIRPPEDLDDQGKIAWKSVVEDLDLQGCLVKTDRKLIEVYARSYSHFRRVKTQLDNEELTILTENGRIFINPLCSIYSGMLHQLRQLLNDLGLSPATRKTLPEQGDNPYKGTIGKGNI